MKLTHKTSIDLYGQSTLKAWAPGVIPYLMGLGFTLREAQTKAAERGHLAYINKVDNLIVTVGKQLVGDILIGDVSTGLTWHAIGSDNTAPAVGDTTLTTEENRLQIASKSRTGNAITLSTFYLAASCTYAIEEAGVFGDAASATPDSGTLLSHYLQSYDNSGGTKDLTFDYELTIS